MIRKAEDCTVKVNESMRGGPGSVKLTEIASADQMYGRARLFSRITLMPGCGIGYHTHDGECEIFLIVRGTLMYNDDGCESPVSAGDVTIVESGHGHGIRNDGTEEAELVALIPLM